VNESLRLDQETAAEFSPALWTAPPDTLVIAQVGENETSEYHRQCRILAENWSASGARVETGVVAGANHFSAPAPLADPASGLTEALVGLCRGGAAQA
jgi:arylformamidase